VPFVARGSYRGRLLALGLLAYFFYQYLEYATFWAFGPLFPLFIAIFASSLAGIVLLASDLERPAPSARFPLKGMAVLCILMSAILTAMWTRMILAALGGRIQGTLHGATTLVVQAYDLGLIVPLMLFTAVASLRRRPIAYLLGPIFAVKAVAMASAICAMLISAWFVEGSFEAVPFAVFACAGLAALTLAVRMLRNLAAGSARSVPVAADAGNEKGGIA
jgi:hypothetical protein